MNNVYVLDINKTSINKNYLLDILPNNVLEEINKYKGNDYLQSLYAWGILYIKLKDDYNIDLSKSEISKNALGKPYIKGIEFNLTHSNNLVGVIISNDLCGIDIQIVRTVSDKFKEKYGDEAIKNFTIKEARVKKYGLSVFDSLDKEDKCYTHLLADSQGDNYYMSICCDDDYNIIRDI